MEGYEGEGRRKKKNDRIDEESNDGENPDSMGHSKENERDESESEELSFLPSAPLIWIHHILHYDIFC